MRNKSIKRNLFFQLFYQLITFLIPLIVAPFLTRTLGSDGLGNYSYINTFVTYTGLIANLGISIYGQRLIASKRDEKDELRKAFWSLYIFHFITSFVALTGYLLVSFLVSSSNSTMLLIQGILVVAMMCDVTWLFYGLEDFKSVVIKSGLIKVLECVLIFALVKQKNDLYIYSFIVGGTTLLGHLVMLPQTFKTAPPIRVHFSDVMNHIKPMMLLFASVVAVTLYTVFDKTLIGFLVSNDAVAYYEYSAKIVEIPKQLLNALGMVILPRACNAFSQGRTEEQMHYFDLSIFITCLFGAAFVFGLSSISAKLSLVYYGSEFAECGRAIPFMSPMILIVLLGNVHRTAYIIPAKLDKQLTFCLLICSAINIALSLILIPFLGLYGAIVGTLCAELFGLLFQAFYCKSVYPPSKTVLTLIPFLICGFIMFAIVLVLDDLLDSSLLSLIFEVFAGAVVYLVLSSVCTRLFFKEKWNEFISLLKIRKTR